MFRLDSECHHLHPALFVYIVDIQFVDDERGDANI